MNAIMQAHTQCSVTCRAKSFSSSGESSKPRALRESGLSPVPALRSRRASLRVALCVWLAAWVYAEETLFHFLKCPVVFLMNWSHAVASFWTFGYVSSRWGTNLRLWTRAMAMSPLEEVMLSRCHPCLKLSISISPLVAWASGEWHHFAYQIL